jgi:hypothetical protein
MKPRGDGSLIFKPHGNRIQSSVSNGLVSLNSPLSPDLGIEFIAEGTSIVIHPTVPGCFVLPVLVSRYELLAPLAFGTRDKLTRCFGSS